MNLKVISKYNIPRKKPTWNDFTWSSIFFYFSDLGQQADLTTKTILVPWTC